MEGALVCLSCGYLSKGIHFLCSYFRIGGASIIAHTAHQINEEIHDKEVRLISAQGEQLGIMPLAEAMAKAGDADLDLVKISPNAVPPVCKLMDYGKFKYDQAIKAKQEDLQKAFYAISEKVYKDAAAAGQAAGPDMGGQPAGGGNGGDDNVVDAEYKEV